MAGNRLEILQQMVTQNPSNNFARYGLATEYANTGNLEQAVEEYRQLLAADPNYAAAYYHGGQALHKLGRLDEARALYRQGIEVTGRIGDLHARSELEQALEALG